MITDVQVNLGNQSGKVYSVGIDSRGFLANESMTPEEAIEFLSQPTKKITHPVLESTLYNPRLEQRIL